MGRGSLQPHLPPDAEPPGLFAGFVGAVAAVPPRVVRDPQELEPGGRGGARGRGKLAGHSGPDGSRALGLVPPWAALTDGTRR